MSGDYKFTVCKITTKRILCVNDHIDKPESENSFLEITTAFHHSDVNEVGSACHFQTSTCPVPSPVKTSPPGPI